jgi:hypothetical protein
MVTNRSCAHVWLVMRTVLLDRATEEFVDVRHILFFEQQVDTSEMLYKLYCIRGVKVNFVNLRSL